MNKFKNSMRKAFSVVEILVVIVIVAILAVLLTPALMVVKNEVEITSSEYENLEKMLDRDSDRLDIKDAMADGHVSRREYEKIMVYEQDKNNPKYKLRKRLNIK